VITWFRPAAGERLLPGVRWVLVIAAALGERSSFAPQSRLRAPGESAYADDALGLTRASAGLRVVIPGLLSTCV
jgi:hypothetical protein